MFPLPSIPTPVGPKSVRRRRSLGHGTRPVSFRKDATGNSQGARAGRDRRRTRVNIVDADVLRGAILRYQQPVARAVITDGRGVDHIGDLFVEIVAVFVVGLDGCPAGGGGVISGSWKCRAFLHDPEISSLVHRDGSGPGEGERPGRNFMDRRLPCSAGTTSAVKQQQRTAIRIEDFDSADGHPSINGPGAFSDRDFKRARFVWHHTGKGNRRCLVKRPSFLIDIVAGDRLASDAQFMIRFPIAASVG